ncbi:MAG: S-layer homology domain-containing protein, partial [Acidimicrobiales bacterium]
PRVDGGNSFSDVRAGAYYEDAVDWAVQEGITTGTSATEFSPNAPVTRGQTALFLFRYLA